ncbi:uncharacterized protein LOC105432009 [Pogonomyrmex barbatus]|uniref:Uncharacterized protein LOC105432009 n=1 Tax=Pogonomyrmex barbatus TaxID=144034 RepID=A0A6I9XHA2_9HYME|nr:uncharacterized protein LOC105432009 [Pogonomyrmex barbatus]
MNKQNISITEPINAVDILDNLFGFEAAQKRQENCDLSTENAKSHFKPWRIFINHIDSYHGKILTDMLSDTVYIDPLNTRADDPSRKENEEFEDEDNEEIEKRKQLGKTVEIPRKYEIIGTVRDRKVILFCKVQVR